MEHFPQARTLGTFKADPVGLEVKEGTKPHHAQTYTIAHVYEAAFQKEIDQLVEISVLGWMFRGMILALVMVTKRL